jgi:hypothetical protein
MDQLSASLTCLSKKVPGAFEPEQEIHSRPQVVCLIFLTLGSKFDTELEHHYDQNANRLRNRNV